MACKRNRIIELKNYFSSLGIDTNVGKNKARGHNGIFMHSINSSRIDISKNLEDDSTLSALVHEFAHYVHYFYDKNLQSLDFAFEELTDDLREELIKITVNEVPKDFAKSLYEKKDEFQNNLNSLTTEMKKYYPDFKLSEKCGKIEKNFSGALRYLLRYDRVKYINKIYSIENLDNDFLLQEPEKLYIQIRAVQRRIKRISSKINRLNKYYNNPSELFARFLASYYTKPAITKNIAPVACDIISRKKIPLLEPVTEIFNRD